MDSGTLSGGFGEELLQGLVRRQKTLSINAPRRLQQGFDIPHIVFPQESPNAPQHTPGTGHSSQNAWQGDSPRYSSLTPSKESYLLAFDSL